MTEHELADADVQAFAQSDDVPASAPDDTPARSRLPPVVALRDRPAVWQAEARDAIEDLSALREDWDACGSKAVDSASIKQALILIDRLASIENIKAPVITATPTGQVGLCWAAETWSLDACISSSGLVDYVFIDERNPTREQEGRTRNPVTLGVLLTQW